MKIKDEDLTDNLGVTLKLKYEKTAYDGLAKYIGDQNRLQLGEVAVSKKSLQEKK